MASKHTDDTEHAAKPADAATSALPARLLVWSKRIGIALGALTTLAVLGGWLTIRHYQANLPSIRELQSYDPPQVTRVLARDGTLLGELFVERRTLVSIDAIPSEMKLAALAAEDAKFYEHAGLNYLGMVRAILVNLRSTHARQGGSTITQQVVKNVLLTPEKTFDRKMREAILAHRIEQQLKKDEILELYLNHIYFGHGRYGVEEAARFYFGKSIRSVTLAEAALLAGIVKGPSVYSPRVDMARARERQRFVLDQMARKGFAGPERIEEARSARIALAPESEPLSELAPEAVDEVKRVLRELLGPAAERGGYTITTTIDPVLEAAARAAVRRNADEYAKRHRALAPLKKSKKDPTPFEGTPVKNKAYHGVVTGADDALNTLDVRVGSVTGIIDLAQAKRYNPDGLSASQFAEIGKVVRVSLLDPVRVEAPSGKRRRDEARSAAPEQPRDATPPKARFRLELGPEGALVAIDNRTREILALVGSYEGVRGGNDRATFAERQPASTFKAFVYGYAIHARLMTPASIVETNKSKLKGYKPDNYDEGAGKQPKRLRDAVAQSVNVAAAWTLGKVGPSNVVAFSRSLGIQTKLKPDLSLALGAYEVTPRQMAGAYATFASGGVYEQPILVKKIVGPGGVEVPLPPRPPGRRVLEPAEAYVVTSLLTSVVREGTGKRAKSLGRPIAGKTGTSNDAKDAWFVGYSTDVTCAVWTGFDLPAPLGAGEEGATAALPVFVDFMRDAHKGKSPADFPVPPGIVHVTIDPVTGLRPAPEQTDAIDEVFLAGSEPTEVAQPDAGADPAPADGRDAGAPPEGTSPPSAKAPLPEEAPPPF
jgi:penicillin-binding protein 1A